MEQPCPTVFVRLFRRIICFVEQGSEVAKISGTAQRSGVTERSVYRYFDSKADLVLETALLFWSEAVEQVEVQVRRELRKDMCGAERGGRILRGYARLYFTRRQQLIFVHEAEAYFGFDMDKVRQYALARNPKLQIFPICAKSGEGVDAWRQWLKDQVSAWQADTDS